MNVASCDSFLTATEVATQGYELISVVMQDDKEPQNLAKFCKAITVLLFIAHATASSQMVDPLNYLGQLIKNGGVNYQGPGLGFRL